MAFLCEGTKPSRGMFTKSSGNKGKQIQFANTDWWLVKLIIDEFKKLGIKSSEWKKRLIIGTNQNEKTQKEWWASKLDISKDEIKVEKIVFRKNTFNFINGMMKIGLDSIILAAIIENLLNMLKLNKL